MRSSVPVRDVAFAFEVVPPERRRRIGDAPPCGSVRLCDEHGSSGYIEVPASVARLMARKQRAGEFAPTSRADLLRLTRSMSRTAASGRIAQLVTRRDYASKELLDKLVSEGFDRQTVTDAVARAADAGLVSDARFADVFVRSKVNAGWGIGRIERELERRGIDITTLEGWPHEYLDPDDEMTRAMDVASRKTVRDPHAREKLARFLVGRGFSYGIALEAAKRTLERRQDDEP